MKFLEFIEYDEGQVPHSFRYDVRIDPDWYNSPEHMETEPHAFMRFTDRIVRELKETFGEDAYRILNFGNTRMWAVQFRNRTDAMRLRLMTQC